MLTGEDAAVQLDLTAVAFNDAFDNGLGHLALARFQFARGLAYGLGFKLPEAPEVGEALMYLEQWFRARTAGKVSPPEWEKFMFSVVL